MTHQRNNLSKNRYGFLLKWRERWTLLVYLLGVATTIFLASAMFLLINKSWLPGALATVTSILTGGAATWLLRRAREAAQAEEEAFERAKLDERDQDKTELAKRAREGLLGRKN